MEKRNRHLLLASACDQQSQTIQPQRKQEKTLPEIAPKPNQQQQTPIVQWPCTPQSATEQFMAVSMATQAASPPGLLNQWPSPPFWHPQWPAGVVPFVTGPNSSPIVQGGTSSTTQTQIPNMCYPFGYTFPGPCDPSSWLGLMQQLQHPYFYHFPGALGFSSATPPMLGCSASGEQSPQSGIIIPTAKLSPEHQKLWEAQSEENARLHSVISKLQAELSDYKDRLTKLEESSSLKRKVKAPPNVVTGTTPLGTGQPRKRGRPRKTLANSVDALQAFLPQAQVVKPAPSKQHPFDIKSPIFEKVILKKVDSKEIPNCPPATVTRQQTNEKILNAVTDVSGNNLINQRKSLLSGERVYFETLQDLKNATSGLAHEVTMTGRNISARLNGYTGNGNHGGASCIPCQKSARELLDAAHKGLFCSSFVQQEQGEKVASGENGANEEESSEDLEDNNLGSGDENEEEMGDGTSSSL